MSLADFITFCGANRDTILGLNGLLSSIMAAVLLWLHHRVLREQKWAKYFGWGFAIFALQYLIQWVTHLGYQFAHAKQLGTGAAAILTAGDFTQDLGLIVNNVLFFMAASALLALSARFTHWVVGASGFILVLNFINLLGFVTLGDWSRIPDKTLAFICLAFLGLGLYVNIRSLLSNGVATLFLASIWLYAIIILLHSFIPFIVRYDWPLNIAVQSSAEKFKHIGIPLTITQSYDAVILVVAILVKVALFSAGLVLMIGSFVMLHPDSYRTTLTSVADGNQEFLSSYGIVYTIANTFAADVAEICLRVPGLEKKKVVWWRWIGEASVPTEKTTSWRRRSRTAMHDWAGFEVKPAPDLAQSTVGSVLVTGKPIVSRNRQTDPSARIYQENVPGMKSFVTVPIRYHKAVIGALNLEWRRSGTFNETTVLQIEQFAAFLAPVLQNERQLAAVDQFAYRLPRLELDDKNGEQRLARRVEVFQDTMSPLATGIAIELGFRQIWAGCNDHESTGDQIAGSASVEKVLAEKVMELSSRKADHVRLEKARLVVKNMRIGTLRMAYPARNDERSDISRPMLGTNYLHRRTVTALMASALLESIRTQLAAALNELHLALHSQEVDSTHKWLDTIEKGIKKAGLIWAVARTSGSQRLLGRAREVATIEYLKHRDGEDRLSSSTITVLDLDSPMEGTYHVVVLPIPAASAHLWLGVSRKGFGAEVHLAPWNEFLERLAEGAGAALLRIIATLEFQRMSLDQARYQGLQTTLVSMGTMTHQLVNFVRGFSGSILNLEEALQTGRLQTDNLTAQGIQELSGSVQKLSDLLKPLTSITTMNQRRPCNLQEVVNHAYELHKFLFRQKRVSFTVRGLNDNTLVHVNIPYDVATLALGNLISNSLDAIDADGSIEIDVQTYREGGMVRCHVIDDGRGVPEMVRSSDPFRLGVTSKDGSGGWGLYLTKRALLENQANVELTKPGPGGTIFTLSFQNA